MGIYIQETFINETKGYIFSETEVYETWTSDEGELFQSLQQEYGRCISRVYRDREEKRPKKIGWVFQKRVKYDDSNETYIREVWVTLHMEGRKDHA